LLTFAPYIRMAGKEGGD